MHTIEPYYLWRDYYSSEDDEHSPFYGRTYSEFEFSNTIYNFYIHPQWDEFGSPTLYIKVLFADYEKGYVIIEMIGERNDAIGNDIMFLKTDIINPMMNAGISKFIVIGENVLNFHASDDCYYEEWYDDINEHNGYIAFVNFHQHVLDEMKTARIHHYVKFGNQLNEVDWRTVKPFHMHKLIEGLMQKELPETR
ncbi:MAG: hypothetical protein ACK53R_06910 [Bacteroidota bacterium]